MGFCVENQEKIETIFYGICAIFEKGKGGLLTFRGFCITLLVYFD